MIIIQVAVAQHMWLGAVHDLFAHSEQNKANASLIRALSLSTVLNEAQTRTEEQCMSGGRLRRCTRDKRRMRIGSATIALAARRAYPSHTIDGKRGKGHFLLTRGSRGCCASVIIITLRNLCNNKFACSLFDARRPDRLS